jgi:uncharacterized membrane protein
MAQYMRCKSCGFLVKEGALGDVCPACGVPRKTFEPFIDPVSEERRRILEFDLHPILVHFPIAFTVSAFAVSVFVAIFPFVFRLSATAVLRALVGTLPLVVIGAFLTGRLDGTVRFRKAKSRLLRTKTLTGIAFFCLSFAAAALTFAVGPFESWVRIADIVLLAGCLGCASLLGRIGKSLLNALFPG